MPQFLGYEIANSADNVAERNESYEGYIQEDEDLLLELNILKKENGKIVKNLSLGAYPEEIRTFLNWISGEKLPPLPSLGRRILCLKYGLLKDSVKNLDLSNAQRAGQNKVLKTIEILLGSDGVRDPANMETCMDSPSLYEGGEKIRLGNIGEPMNGNDPKNNAETMNEGESMNNTNAPANEGEPMNEGESMNNSEKPKGDCDSYKECVQRAYELLKTCVESAPVEKKEEGEEDSKCFQNLKEKIIIERRKLRRDEDVNTKLPMSIEEARKVSEKVRKEIHECLGIPYEELASLPEKPNEGSEPTTPKSESGEESEPSTPKSESGEVSGTTSDSAKSESKTSDSAPTSDSAKPASVTTDSAPTSDSAKPASVTTDSAHQYRVGP